MTKSEFEIAPKEKLSTIHSNEFDQLVRLLSDSGSRHNIDREKAARALDNIVGPIIFRRKRLQSESFVNEWKSIQEALLVYANCVEETNKAIEILRARIDRGLTSKRDRNDFRRLIKGFNKRFSEREEYLHFESPTQLARDLKVVSAILELITKVNARPRPRARPTLPTLGAALDLTDAWKAITGRAAVTPDVKSRGSAAKEHSTFFVEICLRLIFPELTSAQAKTSVRKAIKRRKRPPAALERLKKLISA